MGVSPEGERLEHVSGNLFRARGVTAGDIIYVVTVFRGTLFLCGKMEVGLICGKKEAASRIGCELEDLWDASEHVLGAAATPMRFDLAVPPEVVRGLGFVSGGKIYPPKFVSSGQLDQQTMRGVRELTAESAAALDELLPPLRPVRYAQQVRGERSAHAAPSVTKKYCRICWNTNNWRGPTGEARLYETGSFVTKTGFGFEEWLFNFDWLLKGYAVEEEGSAYRYGFLQPINKYLRKYQGETFSVLLYAISPDGKCLLVAGIDDLYVPEDNELEWALGQMVENGWVDEMRREVEALGGKVNTMPFVNPKAGDLLNVRFRPRDVTFFDPWRLVTGDHKLLKSYRYHPFDWDDDTTPPAPATLTVEPPEAPDEGEDPTRSEALRTRALIEGTTYEPRHIKLQNRLYHFLCDEHGREKVWYERDLVDLSYESDGATTFIEIKMELSARRCVRMALGQLLEYSHYPGRAGADRLLVVGDVAPSDDDAAYLRELRARYGLPVYYAQWDWEKKALEPDV